MRNPALHQITAGEAFPLELVGCNSLKRAKHLVTQINAPNIGIAIDAPRAARPAKQVQCTVIKYFHHITSG
jgi:hypothetical protein